MRVDLALNVSVEFVCTGGDVTSVIKVSTWEGGEAAAQLKQGISEPGRTLIQT